MFAPGHSRHEEKGLNRWPEESVAQPPQSDTAVAQLILRAKEVHPLLPLHRDLAELHPFGGTGRSRIRRSPVQDILDRSPSWSSRLPDVVFS